MQCRIAVRITHSLSCALLIMTSFALLRVYNVHGTYLSEFHFAAKYKTTNVWKMIAQKKIFLNWCGMKCSQGEGETKWKSHYMDFAKLAKRLPFRMHYTTFTQANCRMCNGFMCTFFFLLYAYSRISSNRMANGIEFPWRQQNTHRNMYVTIHWTFIIIIFDLILHCFFHDFCGTNLGFIACIAADCKHKIVFWFFRIVAFAMGFCFAKSVSMPEGFSKRFIYYCLIYNFIDMNWSQIVCFDCIFGSSTVIVFKCAQGEFNIFIVRKFCIK